MLRCSLCGVSEPPKPEKKSRMEELLDRLEPGICDPAILQEAAHFDRIVAEKELIKNGMKWMESEVLQAFEFYKESNCYQVCPIFTIQFNCT
jgi:hypothetical protein